MFKRRLREARISRGMSQQDLADKLGKTQQSVGLYEQGKAEPTVSTIRAIADALGISVDHLLGRDVGPEQMIKVPVFDSFDITVAITDQKISRWEVVPLEDVDGGYHFYLVLNSQIDAGSVPKNSRVLVRKQDSVDDDQVAILIHDCTLKLRRIKRVGESVVLYGIGPNAEVLVVDGNDVRIIGRALRVEILI